MSRIRYLLLIIVFSLSSAGIANAEQFSEIIRLNGKDYVINNQKKVFNDLSDKDKLQMMGFLFVNMRGRDTEKFLHSMAKEGNLSAMRILIDKYSFGKEGYKLNKDKARYWALSLEDRINTRELDKFKPELAMLCKVYEYDTSTIKDKAKSYKYCNQLFSIDTMSGAGYRSMKRSQFYDPKLAVSLYKQCLNDNLYCKVNYAWAAHKNVEIAHGLTKSQIFEYASAALDSRSAGALNNLGTYYDSGFGIQRDRKRALDLFIRATSMEAGYAFYNILNMTFFKTVDSDDLPKNADEAMALISFYDYKSPELDRYDSIPFKEWIFTKKRLPNNSEEFKDFLAEKASNNSDISACAISSHYIKEQDLKNGLYYAKLGLSSGNKFVKQWCENNIDAINVLQTIKE